MTINLADFGIDRLSNAEQIELARAIYRSVAASQTSAPISEGLEAELAARIAHAEREPESLLTLEQLKSRLAERLRR
jgi:putative addiction module component (TIGR02574 family)